MKIGPHMSSKPPLKTTDALLQGYKGISQAYVQKAGDELRTLVKEWLS